MFHSETPKLAAETAAFGTLDDLDCRGRRVFLRVDPFVLDRLDDARALDASAAAPESDPPAQQASEGQSAARETVTPPGTEVSRATGFSLGRLLELEARIVVATHFSPELSEQSGVASIEELASGLSERLNVEALLPDECVGDAAVRVIHSLRPGQICVLPDLATCAGEQKNDSTFARALAAYVDAYVGDAFASSHLDYASLARLPRLVPRRALGYDARRELEVLSDLFSSSRGSVVMVLGGRELSSKIDAVHAWLPRVNHLCVGGAAALTLLVASGRAPAHPSAELNRLAEARSLLGRARDLGVSVWLPVDLLVQLRSAASAEGPSELTVDPGALSDQHRMLDLGPESTARVRELLGKATRVLWWGPLGHVARGGTRASQAVAELCARPALTSVVLGGETRRFVRQQPIEVQRGFELVSTGTTAARALLSGRRLPGIEALRIRR